MWSERSAVSLRFKMQSDVVKGTVLCAILPGSRKPSGFLFEKKFLK